MPRVTICFACYEIDGPVSTVIRYYQIMRSWQPRLFEQLRTEVKDAMKQSGSVPGDYEWDVEYGILDHDIETMIPRELTNANVTMLYSAVELTFKILVRSLNTRDGAGLDFRIGSKGLIPSFRRMVKETRYGDIDLRSIDWNSITHLASIRNCIVHDGGEPRSGDTRLSNLIADNASDLASDLDGLFISAVYIDHLSDRIAKTLVALRELFGFRHPPPGEDLVT